MPTFGPVGCTPVKGGEESRSCGLSNFKTMERDLTAVRGRRLSSPSGMAFIPGAALATFPVELDRRLPARDRLVFYEETRRRGS